MSQPVSQLVSQSVAEERKKDAASSVTASSCHGVNPCSKRTTRNLFSLYFCDSSEASICA